MMRKPPRRWTPHDEQRLLAMIVEGKRTEETAAELKRSVGAVYARAHQMHIPLKRVRLRPRSSKPVAAAPSQPILSTPLGATRQR